jgi:hypothetical protein
MELINHKNDKEVFLGIKGCPTPVCTTIFNCRYHTSNHLSVCHKSTSLSPINSQSVDNWLVWDQSQSKYYLRTKFQDGIDKPQKWQNVCYHPTHQQQSDFLILVLYDFIVQNILLFLLLIDVFLLFVSVLNQLHPISIYIVYISVLLVVFHMMNEG